MSLRTIRSSATTVGIVAALLVIFSVARSETVAVKYRGEVDLAPFTCTDVERSSFVKRVCYDQEKQYMLISLSGTYYHYCSIENGLVLSFTNAKSMGYFHNTQIKGHFDCRIT